MNQRSEEVNQLVRRGTTLLRNGKHVQAAELLEKAHQLDSADFDVQLNLSAAYIIGKQFKKAIPLLEELSESHPDNSMIWTNLGAAYLGNPVLASAETQRNAINSFTKALALDSKAPNIAYNIGLIYKDQKNTVEAIRWFEKALETDPNDKDAQSWIEFLHNVEK